MVQLSKRILSLCFIFSLKPTPLEMITFVRVLTQPHPLAISLSFFQMTLCGMVMAVCPAHVVQQPSMVHQDLT